MCPPGRSYAGSFGAWLVLVAALLGSCAAQRERSCAPSTWTRTVDLGAPDDAAVDLLIVVDDSGPVSAAQAALADAIPELVRALASGDVDDDGTAERLAVESLHVGVVTTDLGAGPSPPSGTVLPDGCAAGWGDDGVLRSGIGGGGPCTDAVPPIFEFGRGDDPALLGGTVACTVAVGSLGCMFAQPLEAALKALAPESAAAIYVPDDYAVADSDPSLARPPTFLGGTRAHGDTLHDGFLRRRSTLAILLLARENDCSAADPALWYDEPPFDAAPATMRCFAFPTWLHPARRYVQNFLHLREHPSRLVFSAITGIPPELAASSVDALEVLRIDPRMAQIPDDLYARVLPACEGATSAAPASRVVEVARGLSLRGAASSIHSICEDDYRPALTQVAELVLRSLEHGCVGGTVPVDASGNVRCRLEERLGSSGEHCRDVAGTSLVGTEMVAGEVREVCGVRLLSTEETARGEAGVSIDTSDDARRRCGTEQRIVLSGHEPPDGAAVRWVCDVEVGTPCVPSSWPGCAGNPALRCDPVTLDCGLPCESDADCASAGDGRCDLRPLGEITGDPTDGPTPRGFCVQSACVAE